MLLHIILMQPYPQIVFPDTPFHKPQPLFVCKAMGEAFVELWDGVPEPVSYTHLTLPTNREV